MFKLLILDIDGVLTDGTKIYDTDSVVIGKRYNDRDFTAIKRFKAQGIAVCFLSGDNKVNEAMAKKRKIDFYYARNKDHKITKGVWVDVFKETYNVCPSDMAYVGDDIFDIDIMTKVGHPYCPTMCPKDVRSVCTEINRAPGEAVVAELYDMVL